MTASDAERKRRERLLKRAGMRRIPIYVHEHAIETLVARGEFAEVDKANVDQVGVAIGRLIDDMMDMLAAGVLDQD